jgi:hypothetical protein
MIDLQDATHSDRGLTKTNIDQTLKSRSFLLKTEEGLKY